MIKTRCVIVQGKRRIIITSKASGVDKTKDAVIKVMGQGWEYTQEEATN